MDASRNIWVDYAKAIGIILVVYGHVARGVLTQGLIINQDIYKIVDKIIYSFHMPLFFFLSGLFLIPSLTTRTVKNFLFGKFDTIIYPYIVWSLLQGLIEVALSHYTNGHTTMSEVFSLAWIPRAQFWFLYVLFFIFVFASLIYKQNSSEKWCAGIFAGSILLYFFGGLLPYFYITSMLTHNLIYFSFGTLAAFTLKRYNENGNWTFILLGAIVVFVLSQWIFQVSQGSRYNSAPGIILMLAIIGIGSVVVISHWLAQFNLPWLAYLGRHSMAIYLVHILAGSGCRIILLKLFGVTDVGIHLLLGTLCGLLLPVLFYWWCSRTGFNVLFFPPKLIQLRSTTRQQAT